MKDFIKASHEWYLLNRNLVDFARTSIRDQLDSEDHLVRVDAWLGFHYEKLFTKKHVRKKMDASNRIKAFHDALSDILMIDDRYFMVGDTKPVLAKDTRPECILIKLSVEKIELMEDLLNPTTLALPQ